MYAECISSIRSCSSCSSLKDRIIASFSTVLLSFACVLIVAMQNIPNNTRSENPQVKGANAKHMQIAAPNVLSFTLSKLFDDNSLHQCYIHLNTYEDLQFRIGVLFCCDNRFTKRANPCSFIYPFDCIQSKPLST